MKHNWKRVLSVVLTVALLSAFLVPMASATNDREAAFRQESLELTPIDASTLDLFQGNAAPEEAIEQEPYRLTDTVRVSIVLEQASTIGAGFGLENIARNAAAISYRDGLKAAQAAATARIEAATGKALQVKWNLTLAADIISANVLYGDIETIKAVDGVKDVFVENRHEPDLTFTGEKGGAKPQTGPSSGMIGSSLAWAQGYTGAGSKIAIIDTGADTEHISFSGEGLDYALAQNAEAQGLSVEDYLAELDLLDAAAIDAVAGQLNVRVTGAAAYHSTKIPYGYNYVDGGYDVTHENDVQGDHGSHVAGIATANRYVNVDDEWQSALRAVGVQGVAPDAQLLVMKVFGQGGGAYDSDYMSAIEDAIVLGCDSANLSLGSGAPGFSFSRGYQDVMDSLVENGMVVSFSAGNSGMWYDVPYNDDMYPYLYMDDVNYATGGDPGAYSNSLTVASVDNAGQTGYPLYFNGDENNPVFYSETSGYGNAPIATLAGETLEYVFVNSPGVDDNGHVGGEGDDFAALGSEILTGKVAICWRGSSSFFAKANAAMAQGAIGIIIANNQSGAINMNLTGYEFTAPAVSILQADGQRILSESAPVDVDEDGNADYYTGALSLSDELTVQAVDFSDHVTMSSFSSYGPAGTLELKPEISAPGGSIYSVNGHNYENGVEGGGHEAYTTYSGTSMAAPQVAGMAAVVAQYIRENDLTGVYGHSQRQLINSLLMSTAVPTFDSYEEYWAVFRQGAGLANVNAAVSAKNYIMMDRDSTIFASTAADGKVKAELGDDPDYEGVYSFGFTIYPIDGEAVTYDLRTELFTQYLAGNAGYGYLADTGTATLSEMLGLFGQSGQGFSVAYTVDGADSDGTVTVGAEPVHVRVNIQLDFMLIVYMYSYFGGFYVEGYTFLEPEADAEGAAPDVNYSIPILGYCGSWTDAAMLDRTSVIDEAYGTGKLPYIANTETNYMTVKDAQGNEAVYMGNPFTVEEAFPADRLALRSDAAIGRFNYLNIRNVGTLGFAVQNADGRVLFAQTTPTQKYSAYYYVNGDAWMNTSPANYTVNKPLSSVGVAEGDEITVGFYALPEYYGLDSEGSLSSDGLTAALESGVIGVGAGIAYTVTVDDTAPTVTGALRDLITGDITVKAQDNQYIAFIGVTNKSGSKVYAGGVPEQTAPGEAVEFPLDLTGVNLPGNAVLVVGDYAGNVSAFELSVGGGSDSTGGMMLGFVTGSTTAAPGSGNRVWEIDRDTLTYNYSTGAYDGLSVYSAVPCAVVAAEYVNGYVFMAADDGYFYAADLNDISEFACVGSYSSTTDRIYDMAYNRHDARLYVLGEDNTIYRLDMLTGELEEAVIVDLSGKVNKLAIDGSGWFYVATNGGPSSATLYKFKPAPVAETVGPEEIVYAETGSFGFETDPADDGWTFADADGDGNNWYWTGSINGDLSEYAYEGRYFITSASYAGSALTPDNWAISPAFNLSGETELTVSLWARGQDASWAAEHFAVYAGTSRNVNEMTQISDEYVASGEYVNITADLSAFAGEDTVFVAVRHFNVTDMFRLNVDLFEILDGAGEVIVPGPAVETEPEEQEPEVSAEVVAPEAIGLMGVWNYSNGGALAWDHNTGNLYLASNYNASQDYDHYLWLIDADTAVASRANSVSGTELATSNPSARLYGAVNGLFIVPGGSTGFDTAEEATGLEADPAELNMMRGQTVSLSAKVYPWTLENKAVSFAIDDETVATVAADGAVTAVGVGEAVITITTVAEPHLTATVNVTVTEAPAAQLRGVIWDEGGKGQMAVFDTDDPAAWTSDFEISLELCWGALIGDTIYASTDDTLYAIDADSYEATELGGIVSMWIPSDATELPQNLRDAFAAMGYDVGPVLAPNNNGTYLSMIDPEEGGILYFDLSSYVFGSDPMAAIAFSGYVDEDGTAYYFLMSESGMLYLLTIDEEGSASWAEMGETGIDLSGVADSTNQIWASLVYDEENDFLYLSHFDGTSDVAVLYAIDPNDPACNAVLGDFNDSVWPVVGLYEYEPATDLVLKVSPESVSLYEGETEALDIKIKLGETNAFTVVSADDTIASVDADGVVTGVAEGETTVTVTTVDVNAVGETLSVEIPVTVKGLISVDYLTFGQISDADGDHLAVLDLNDLSWQSVGEAPFAAESAALTGDIYLMSDGSSITAVDMVNFEEAEFDYDSTYFSSYPPQDIANYPMFLNEDGELDTYKALFTTSLGWLVTPDYYGWDLSGYLPDMAAIAFGGVYGVPGDENDVNLDGVTDEADAQAVLDICTGVINSSAYDAYDLDAADADGDGDVTTADARLILEGLADELYGQVTWYYIYYILTQSGILYELDIDVAAGNISLYGLFDTGIVLANQSDASMTFIDEGELAGLVVADNNSKRVWYIDFYAETMDELVGLIGTADAENIVGLVGTYDGIACIVDPADMPVDLYADAVARFSFGFESEDDVNEWTFVDADEDGYGWEWNRNTASWFSGTVDFDTFAYEGTGSIVSGSYINTVGELEPDNWAISPAIDLSEAEDDAALSIFAKGHDSDWAAENFRLYAGTSADPAEMTAISGDFTATGKWKRYTGDLSDFAGESEVYVAIRHYDISDMYILDVDQVEVFWGLEEAEEPEAVEIPTEAARFRLPQQLNVGIARLDGSETAVSGIAMESLIARSEASESLAAKRTGKTGSVAAPDFAVLDEEHSNKVDTMSVVLCEEEASANGLITVSYDPDNLPLNNFVSELEFFSMVAGSGTVTFAYAAADPYAAETALATLTFGFTVEETEGFKGTVTVTTVERNDELGLAETTEVELGIYSEPEWTWTLTEDEESYTATATFRMPGEEDVVVDATVELDEENSFEPTCEETGLTVYTAVAEFEDEEYTDTLEIEIDALDHAWGEPTYEWAEDNSTVTATRVCANNEEHVETETVNTTSEVTTDPTCTVDGVETFTAVFENEAFETQTKEVAVEAPGHEWLPPVWEWTWSWDKTEAQAVAVFGCEHEDIWMVQNETTVTSVTTPATCTEAGSIVFTATAVFRGETYTDEQTVVLEATGHDYTAEWTWADDHSKATLTLTCATNPEHVLTQEVEAEVTTEGSTKTYTVTAEVDGQTFTDSKSVETAIVTVPVTVTPTEPNVKLYDDAKDKNDWFFDAVYWSDGKVADPKSETWFGVADAYSRAETVMSLWKAVGSPEPTTSECPFVDVSESDVFYKAILWASETGVTLGVDATHFDPTGTVTRGQAVTFLYRAVKATVPEDATNPFADVAESDYYYAPILWAVANGITNGVDENHFAPANTLTKGHIVTFLYRLYK